MKFGFLLLTFTFSFSNIAFAVKKEKKLLRLVEAEIRSIVKVKTKKDRLAYRLFELYAEKMKLNRKLEDEKVVKGKLSKKRAYTVSNKYYNESQNYGVKFLKDYPKSRYVSNVYMTMATNILEIKNDPKGDEAIVTNYLKNAIRTAVTPDIRHNSRMKLAELYYTLEKFPESIKYYEIVIRNTRDPWYTKSLLNLSWCYFQTKEYQKATDLALLAHQKSRLKRYSDVRDQVANAVNYFYTFNKEPEKAIDFHIKYSKNTVDTNIIHLLNLALRHISSTVALRAEVKARKYCEAKKKYECLYQMSQFKLDIYKEAKDYENHYRSVASLISEYKKLTKKQIATHSEITNLAINNIAELSSYIQSLAYKDHYILSGGQEATYKRLIANYEQLKVLNKGFTYEYAFLQAEISYKEKNYQDSSKFYLESLGRTPKNKREEFYPKLFKSMISLANEKSYDNKKFFEKTYVNYIKWRPRDPATSKQFDNLFKFYMNEKDIKKAIALVDYYNKKQPLKLDDHKEMVKVVLNHHVKMKDTTELAGWVKKLKTGYMKFDAAFIEKNVTVLAQLLFQKTKKLEDTGKTKMAVQEYKKIYSNEIYPQRIKNDSAFNISIIYLKQNHVENSYAWMKKMIETHIPSNLVPKMDVLLTTAQQYYLLQSPERSHDLYKFVTENYCDKSKTYPKHYTQIQELNLALRKYETFSITQNNATKCKVDNKLVDISKGSYVDLLVQEGEIEAINKYIKNQVAYKPYQDMVFADLLNRFWQNDFEHGDLTSSKNYQNLKEYANGNMFLTQKNVKDINSLVSFVNYYQRAVATKTDLAEMKEFDVNKFNTMFTQSLTALTNMKEQGMSLADGAKDANIYSATLATIYYKFAEFQNEVLTFKVNSTDKDMVKEVQRNLKMIVDTLSQQMAQVEGSYKKSDKNDVAKNQFAKYFNYNKEMGQVSLYKNKEVNVLNVNKGM